MEMTTGVVLLILFPLVLYARQQVDAANARRRREADGGDCGVDIIIDPAAGDCSGGNGGCGGGCGGCGG